MVILVDRGTRRAVTGQDRLKKRLMKVTAKLSDNSSNLPETSYPGLSLSDLQLAAAAAAVGEAAQGEDEDGADDGGGGFCVRSVTQTPGLDGRWNEKVLSHKTG